MQHGEVFLTMPAKLRRGGVDIIVKKRTITVEISPKKNRL